MKRNAFLLIACALAIFALGDQAAEAQNLSRAVQAQTIPAAELLNSDGTLNLQRLREGSVDLSGWNVSLDPKRGPVFARDEKTRGGGSSTAGSSNMPVVVGNWSALGNGVDFDVFALAVSGSTVYIGGAFAQICGACFAIRAFSPKSAAIPHAIAATQLRITLPNGMAAVGRRSGMA